MSRIAVLSLLVLLPAAQAEVVKGGNGSAHGKEFHAVLVSHNEVPSVSSAARGGFRGRLTPDGGALHYELAYSGLEGDVTQAHIHFGQRHVNGGVSVWLCSNLPSPPTPVGVQPCPAPPARISGIITANEVVGPEAQGIAPGQFGELIQALRKGAAYANVHSSLFPGGEIRSQLHRKHPD